MIKKIISILIILQSPLFINSFQVEIPYSVQKKMLSFSLIGAAYYLIHNYTPIFPKIRSNFTHLEDNDLSYLLYETEQAKNSQEAYVFAHGFNGSGFSSHIIGIANSNPSGKCYSLHFEDARTRRLFKTSLGQDNDIQEFVQLLSILSKKYTVLHLIGHSRGAATIINSIAVLNQPEHPLLTKTGITEHIRKEILEKICNGSVILKTPLLHIETTSKILFTHYLGVPMHYICAFLTLLRYKPWSYQAIDTIKQWNGLNIKVLLFFAQKDSVVGNSLDQTFIKKIKKIIPNTDIFFYDGNHTDQPKDYRQKIQEFYE